MVNLTNIFFFFTQEAKDAEELVPQILEFLTPPPPPEEKKEGGGGEVLGMVWDDIGAERPDTGLEILNDALAEALKEKTSFSQDEWAKFEVKNKMKKRKIGGKRKISLTG